ncbi:glyoxalase superfamily protein [Kribbella sp. NPDC051770]|uniref:glyoxalase superfamily protein n=1 Tax=Kribbella sp. NPDC051770 TaxID=3155413 RepID=UPI003434CC27
MPKLETYKKQAKLLVRRHREGNHSIGGRIRQLDRYRELPDREALALKFPLTEAQEIIALEAGFATWAELKASTETASPAGKRTGSPDSTGAPRRQAMAPPTSAPPAAPAAGERMAATPTGERMAATPTGKRMAATPTGERVAGIPSSERLAAAPSSERLAASPTSERLAAVLSSKQPMASLAGEQPAAPPTGKQPEDRPAGEQSEDRPAGKQGADRPTAEQPAVPPASEQPEDPPAAQKPAAPHTAAASANPVLFVADVEASATYYRDLLGFRIDFLHGKPPFYGSVSRDGATLHLKFVHEPVFAPGVAEREGLIMAFVETPSVRDLYAEYLAAGAEIVQKLTKQLWGGTDFIVRDPDGNAIAFVGLARPLPLPC